MKNFIFFLVFGFSSSVLFAQQPSDNNVASNATRPIRASGIGRTVDLLIRDSIVSLYSASPDKELLIKRLQTSELLRPYIDQDAVAKREFLIFRINTCRESATSGFFSQDSTMAFAKEAVELIDECINQNLTDVIKPFCSDAAALCMSVLKDSEKAFVYLDKLISLDPKEASPYILKSQIYKDQGQMTESCQVLKNGVELGCKHCEYLLEYYECNKYLPKE